MQRLRPQPVDSLENLRCRIDRLLRSGEPRQNADQQELDLFATDAGAPIVGPSKSIVEFLNFLGDAVPDGDVYLFGGVLRDVALFGSRGFTSDIDLVVEGDWTHCVRYLVSLGADRNKFGGFRLQLGDWPIDIWNATDTWAIREGLVAYRNIGSLTETVVLNWDAILMNWRTGAFVCRDGYLEDLRQRILDVVLVANPNPLGMTVRVLRHLCSKDATRITGAAAGFLVEATSRYSYAEIAAEEMRSYGNSFVRRDIYRRFDQMRAIPASRFDQRFLASAAIPRRELQLI